MYKPESEVVYFERSEVPISSTQIRFDPYKQWQYLPPVCREYYAKRVLVVGSESTGKSTLVLNLAIAYNTNYVVEVGRETCENAGGEYYMNADDMLENIIFQKAEEIQAVRLCNRLLFIDTDALTTKFYSQLLLKEKTEIERCNCLADVITSWQKFDLVLFLEPTVDFIQDGTRNEEIKANRLLHSNKLKKLFIDAKIELILLNGSYQERFDKAKVAIERAFDIKTVW